MNPQIKWGDSLPPQPLSITLGTKYLPNHSSPERRHPCLSARTKSVTKLTTTIRSFLSPFLGQAEGCRRLLRNSCLLSCSLLSHVGQCSWTPTPCPPVLGQQDPFSSAQARAPGEARLPTFSWALLNFFCICLAKRPAAPPALPSAILPAAGGAAWSCGF